MCCQVVGVLVRSRAEHSRVVVVIHPGMFCVRTRKAPERAISCSRGSVLCVGLPERPGMQGEMVMPNRGGSSRRAHCGSEDRE